MNDFEQKAGELFSHALELVSPEERARYLDEACGGDNVLRERVEALLEASERAEGFLIIDERDERVAEGPGSIIDRYKLLEEIGEGGFGVVFMAEQIEPIRRRVALKIVKPGMDTRQVIARFEAERQALALMDHPNIAHVFDAGSTESGRPYFVMELVHGVPITQYCDDNTLTPEERLKLFIPVCEAVQHAHQKGIIHRDLKPTNILVTLHDGKPVPKVIDFGTAKALQQSLTEKTMFTAYGKLIGTPQYMSPEQAEMSGLDVDTRADIYSLGVLLYELLTGTTPFEKETLRLAAFEEMMRMIRQEEPPKPSARVSTLGARATDIANHRHVDPKQLQQTLSGDLDWIVMKALEKDRRRRYDSAAALVEDLELHVARKPISAAPPSLAYRSGKFIRRHKIAITMAAFVALFIMGLGLALTNNINTMPKPFERTGEELLATLRGQKDRVHGLAYAPRKKLLASCSYDGTIQLWAAETGVLLATLDGHRGKGIWAASFSPDEQTLATTGGDGRILFWDVHRKKLHSVFLENEGPECGEISFSPDGSLLATMARDSHSINLWDVHSGNQVSSISSQSGNIHHFEFSPDGDLLAYSTERAYLEIVDSPSGRLGWSRKGDRSQVTSLSFSPDGSILATACGADQRVRLYDVESGTMVQELAPNHDGWVWSVAFSPIGQWLASESSGIVTIWDMKTHKRLADIEAHFAPDSWGKNLLIFMDANTLVSGSADRDIKIWDVPAAISSQEGKLALAEYHVLVRDGKLPQLRRLVNENAENDSVNVLYWRNLGIAAAYIGNWPIVVDSYSRALELEPYNAYDQLNLFMALVRTGQDHNRLCHELISLIRAHGDPTLTGIASVNSLFLPVDSPDFQAACHQADVDVNVSTQPPITAWYQMGKALADYRRERFESAILWTSQILTSSADAVPECVADAWFIQAAAQAAMGDVDEARAALDRGDEWLGRIRNQTLRVDWGMLAFIEHLREEAVARLESGNQQQEPSLEGDIIETSRL